MPDVPAAEFEEDVPDVVVGRLDRQRRAIEAMISLGREIGAKYRPTTHDEIRAWIDEGRP